MTEQAGAWMSHGGAKSGDEPEFHLPACCPSVVKSKMADLCNSFSPLVLGV